MTHIFLSYSITITTLLFAGCRDAMIRVPIRQVFAQDQYKAYNIHFENGDCVLELYYRDQIIFDEEIAKMPCLIKSIKRDTITVERLLLAKPPEDTRFLSNFKTIKGNLVLHLRDRHFSGSMNWGTTIPDSSHVDGDALVCYYKGDKTRIRLNELLFNGKEFSTLWFKGPTMNVRYYVIRDARLRQRYWHDDKYQFKGL